MEGARSTVGEGVLVLGWSDGVGDLAGGGDTSRHSAVRDGYAVVTVVEKPALWNGVVDSGVPYV